MKDDEAVEFKKMKTIRKNLIGQVGDVIRVRGLKLTLKPIVYSQTLYYSFMFPS